MSHMQIKHHPLHSQVWEICRPSWIHRWFPDPYRDARVVELLTRIADEDGTSAIRDLARYLAFESIPVRVAVARILESLLEGLDPIDLLQLDGLIEPFEWHASLSGKVGFEAYGLTSSPQWSRDRAQDLEGLVSDDSLKSTVYGLASLNGSGYVREAAVKLLATCDDGREIAFLVIRQNDWVTAVSSVAQQAVLERIDDRRLPYLLACLPLLLRYHTNTRRRLTYIVDSILQLLVSPSHNLLLQEALRGVDQANYQRLLRILQDLPGEHRPRVIHQALNSANPVIRLIAARRVKDTIEEAEQDMLIEQLRRDTSMPVRQLGLRLAAERNTASARAIWEAALLDSHISIRELAQYHARKFEDFNISDYYRTQLGDRSRLVNALLGLAEVGRDNDVECLIPYLTNERVRVRVAAVRAIGRLGKSNAVDLLIRSVQDESPGVSKEACLQLRELKEHVDRQRMFEILLNDHRTHVARAILSHWIHEVRWENLTEVILALRHPQAEVGNVARKLVCWHLNSPSGRKVFLKPTSEERCKIRQAFQQMADRWDPQIVSRYDSWLRMFE